MLYGNNQDKTLDYGPKRGEEVKSLLQGLITICLALGLTSLANAKELARVEESHSTLVIDADMQSVSPGQSFWLAITITPRSGWHSYWKNAGDSGASPAFDWRLDGDATIGEPQFPVPRQLPLGPLTNYGYDAPVTLLLPAKAPVSGSSLTASLEAEWLICEVECVPQVTELSLTLPVGEAKPDGEAQAIFNAARAAMPDPSFWSSDLTVGAKDTSLTVYMAPSEAEEVADAYFFPEGVGVLDYAAAQSLERASDGIKVHAKRPSGAPTAETAAGVLLLTYHDGTTDAFAMEPMLKVTVDQTAPQVAEAAPVVSLPLWEAAVFALIGGVILNLMPCVFPILSLKAFAFVSANYKTAANRQKEGWAYTLGIWLSFMVIVASLLVLRAGGTAVGWGFQLQEPVFVGLMTLLMLVVALSLSGMFNIQFGIEGAGQSLAAREGVRGAFFKGILAALVATPCTAPFMAPAIGFALTQPVLIVLMVFSFLALGLALPFLALSYSPALARAMPRPGPWMEKVKEGLAFPMYLTAAWLLYVFTRETGAVAMLVLLAAIIGIVFAIWIGKQSGGRLPVRILAWAIAAFSVYSIISKPWQEPAHTAAEGYVEEIAYSGAELATILESGKPVFVYFTADWCITCKVNERIAVLTDTTQQVFRETGTVVMKGDWTNRNAEIAAVLAKHGRAGVPLYLYYPAGASAPIVLPEILGPSSISNLIANQKG